MVNPGYIYTTALLSNSLRLDSSDWRTTGALGTELFCICTCTAIVHIMSVFREGKPWFGLGLFVLCMQFLN